MARTFFLWRNRNYAKTDSGGGYFKGLQNKRRMSQDQSDRFKDQTPTDTIGSTFAKLTGITGSSAKGPEEAAQ